MKSKNNKKTVSFAKNRGFRDGDSKNGGVGNRDVRCADDRKVFHRSAGNGSVVRRPAGVLRTFVLLIFVIVGIFAITGCNLQNGRSTTDGETITVRATVTVKDRSNDSPIEGATVTIEPTVTTDGPTYYFEEESGKTNTLGVVTVTAEKAVSSPSSDIIGIMPKISITISHEEYQTGNFVEYGSGLRHDEEDHTYRSSLTVVENISPETD